MGMRELGAHIRALRDDAGLTQEELGLRAGVTHSAISKMEHGRQKGTDYVLLRKLAAALGQDVRVFDAILRDEPLPPAAVPAPEIAREVALVGDVSAGPGAFIEGYEYVGLSEWRGKLLAAVRVRGDCMEPEIHAGDIVVFDRNQVDPRNGQIVVALVSEPDGDKGVVKRFYRFNGKVKLEPLVGNPIIRPVEEVKIQGVVVEVRRKYG
jgi:SOS-response transcriptional repressor LexA